MDEELNSVTLEDENDYQKLFPFIQMEDLYDKLKLLNYENDFVKKLKMRPFNRHYFALQTNSGEQFFAFATMSAWLIRKCKKKMDYPQEYDDPNSTIAVIMDFARQMDILVDFPPNKLKQGFGYHTIYLLHNLSDSALMAARFVYNKPVIAFEKEEEVAIESNAELMLERIEEEMADQEGDSEDEDALLPVEDLKELRLDFQDERMLESTTNNHEWRLELERVLPLLKLTIKTDSRDWRNHLEQIKPYKATISDTTKCAQNRLDALIDDIDRLLEKVTSKEQFYNSNFDLQLTQYRTLRDELKKLKDKYETMNGGVMDLQYKLSKISEKLENTRKEMDKRGASMTDGAPLVSIKKAFTTIKMDIQNLDVQIGVLHHDTLQSRLRTNTPPYIA